MSTNDSPVSDSDSQYSDVTGAGVKLPEPEEREGESGTARADQQIEVDRLDCIFWIYSRVPQ